MDKRIYFVIGDLIANIFVGVVIALVCWLMVSTGWNMFLAMILAMVVGMIVAFPLSILFVAPYGAMEVMMPVMLTGMVSGMVVGMWESMQSLSFLEATLLGLVCGITSILFVWIMNNGLKGVQKTALTSIEEDHHES